MKTCEESGLTHVCDEIVDCLASGSRVIEGNTPEERKTNARAYFEEVLQLSGADYGHLNSGNMRRVLTMLAGREMKSGRDVREVTENIKRIAQLL